MSERKREAAPSNVDDLEKEFQICSNVDGKTVFNPGKVIPKKQKPDRFGTPFEPAVVAHLRFMRFDQVFIQHSKFSGMSMRFQPPLTSLADQYQKAFGCPDTEEDSKNVGQKWFAVRGLFFSQTATLCEIHESKTRKQIQFKFGERKQLLQEDFEKLLASDEACPDMLWGDEPDGFEETVNPESRDLLTSLFKTSRRARRLLHVNLSCSRVRTVSRRHSDQSVDEPSIGITSVILVLLKKPW